MEDVHLLIKAPMEGSDLWAYLRVDSEVRRVMLFRKKIFEVSQVADSFLMEMHFIGSPVEWWTGEVEDLPEQVYDQGADWHVDSFYGVAFDKPQGPENVYVVRGEGVGISSEGFFFYGKEAGSEIMFQTEPLPWSALDPPALSYGKVIQLFGPAR